MATEAERITALIAQRPGIRTAEIADELGLDPEVVPLIIKRRLETSQIIAEQVPGIEAGKLHNAYRINPKWTPEDGNFVAEKSNLGEDGERPSLPVRQSSVPASQAAAIPAPRQKRKYVRKAKPGEAPVPADAKAATKAKPAAAKAATAPAGRQPQKQVEAPVVVPVDAAKPVEVVVEPNPFVCAVYHDGRGEIRTAEGRIVLTAEQREIVGRHFSAQPTPAAV